MTTTKTHLAGKLSVQINFGIHRMSLKTSFSVTFHETLLECLRDLLKFCQNSRMNAFRDPFWSILHETLLKAFGIWSRNSLKFWENAFGAPSWSRTSPAGPPGQPGWLALPGWPVGCLAGQAGVLAGQQWTPGGMHESTGAGGRGGGKGEAAQATLPPPAPITAGGLFHIHTISPTEEIE